MTDWLNRNDRIRRHPQAAISIAAQYGRDWRAGRSTAISAAAMNTPFWQENVLRQYGVVST